MKRLLETTPRTKVLLSWSGGKDSAMALAALAERDDTEVVGLLTTVASAYGRVSHHGVREELMVEQAAAVGLPLHRIYLPADRCSNVRFPPTERHEVLGSVPARAGTGNTALRNEEYEALMERTMREYLARGVATVAFGDLFLADLRRYRERNLAKVGMTALFPLWGSDTRALVRSFVLRGFRARLVCVCARQLGPQFAGRSLDEDLLRDLPPGVDPCGENGEYHSFVTDGPVFRRPVPVDLGLVVQRGEQWFADLLPRTGAPA
jgi:uncharacterized protein (TIGR00290 family)